MDSLGSLIKFICEMLWPRRNIWVSQSPIGLGGCQNHYWAIEYFFSSVRLPLSASARKDVSFRVLWLGNTRGYKQGAVLSEDVQEQEKIPNLESTRNSPKSQDIMYENLVLWAAAFFSGREGDGLHGCTTIILTRIFDNKVCEVQYIHTQFFLQTSLCWSWKALISDGPRSQ